jgi:hypothetical protein
MMKRPEVQARCHKSPVARVCRGHCNNDSRAVPQSLIAFLAQTPALDHRERALNGIAAQRRAVYLLGQRGSSL